MISAFFIPAAASCINLCSTRSDPVRWTSTSIPVYFCLKAWAIAVADGSATEVYQTTDASFLAA